VHARVASEQLCQLITRDFRHHYIQYDYIDLVVYNGLCHSNRRTDIENGAAGIPQYAAHYLSHDLIIVDN